MRSKIIWIAAILVVVVVAGYLLLGKSDTATTYRFGNIDRGDIVVSITATGTLDALTTVQVGSQVSGTISKLYADFNSVVKQGQLLAQLDPTFLEASVREAKANASGSQAQLNEAERNFKRTSDLFAKSLVSQADLDAATTSLESAKANVQQAEASLQRAEINLKYATILAPIDGVVVSRNVDVGQTVAASLQAPTLFSIANDLRKMQLSASIDEADIGNIRDGEHVTFNVDAYPDQEFEGTVSQIRLAPVVTQGVVTYNVIIAVANPDQKLLPGMTANVTIVVDERDDVLRVPLQAIRFTPVGVDVSALQTEARPEGAPGGQSGAVAQTPPQDSSRTGVGGQPGPMAQGEGRRQRGPGGGQGMMPQGQGPQQHASGEKPGGMRARVWILENGKPKPVSLVRGIENTRYAEIRKGDLKEGDQVIIGSDAVPTASNSQGQSPFAPRFGGGPGGRH